MLGYVAEYTNVSNSISDKILDSIKNAVGHHFG